VAALVLALALALKVASAARPAAARVLAYCTGKKSPMGGATISTPANFLSRKEGE